MIQVIYIVIKSDKHFSATNTMQVFAKKLYINILKIINK